MYARNYGDDGRMQSFKRGEYSIPANYAGNAFTADEIPDFKNTPDGIGESEIIPEAASPVNTELKEEEAQVFTIPKEEKKIVPPVQPCMQGGRCPVEHHECHESCINHHESEKPRRGIFHDLLTRFERGFELDDLLLIGLIILLLNSGKDDCDGSRDEIIILLAFLLISGF